MKIGARRLGQTLLLQTRGAEKRERGRPTSGVRSRLVGAGQRGMSARGGGLPAWSRSGQSWCLCGWVSERRWQVTMNGVSSC